MCDAIVSTQGANIFAFMYIVVLSMWHDAYIGVFILQGGVALITGSFVGFWRALEFCVVGSFFGYKSRLY